MRKTIIDCVKDCVHMASLCRMASREIPTKTPLIFNVALSLHTLSHTTLNIEIPHKMQGTYDQTKLQSNLA